MNVNSQFIELKRPLVRVSNYCIVVLLGFMPVLSGCGGGNSSVETGATELSSAGPGVTAAPDTIASPGIVGGSTTSTCGGVGTDSPSTAGSALVLQVGGTEAGVTHDLLQVDGSARLGGALQVVFEDGYTPAKGQRFTVVKAACIAGRFDSITANRGISLGTSQDAGTLTVVVQ